MHRSNICLEFLMTIFLCRITGYLEVAEIKLLLEPSGNWFVIYPVTLNKTFVCLSDFSQRHSMNPQVQIYSSVC